MAPAATDFTLNEDDVKESVEKSLEDDSEDQEAPSRVIQSSQVEKYIEFLEHYGIDTEGYSDDEIIAKMDKIRAAKEVAVQVLSRGQALDGIGRLLKHVPRGFVGEFKRERDVDIQFAESLGWAVFVDPKLKKKESPTGAADGKIRLGDQILMIMPEENYVALRVSKVERRLARRKARDPKKVAKEETREFSVPVIPM